MKVTIDIPFESITGRVYQSIEDLHITLPACSSAGDLRQAFKTVMYALTYHPETIDRTLGEADE